VEQPQKGFGRARLIPVADAKAKTVRAFLADHVEPGSTVVTDGFASYAPCTVPNLASRVVSCAFVEVRPPCGTR
jgi:transposase-like protein